MKKVILAIGAIILFSGNLFAQFSERSIGIGLSRWFNTDYTQEIASVQGDITISCNGDKTLVVPYVSMGKFYGEVINFKEQNEIKRSFLWEAGSSFLFKTTNKIYLGVRLGGQLTYNKYDRFSDKINFNPGIEAQYDLDWIWGNLYISSLYLNVSRNSFGVGFRF